MDDIRIAWRKWLGFRVKIIDEYNRIRTRTQSALLTVMGDNYAELLDHIYECPESAWYFTTNDDQGGGIPSAASPFQVGFAVNHDGSFSSSTARARVNRRPRSAGIR